MNRKINIELYEEHDRVNFYTLQFEGEETEFDKFYDAFPEESEFSEDVDIVIKWIDKVGERGAEERYFRPEGKYEDGIFAIPIEMCNLRLYVLRISENIVILGNGGVKTTATYNEDPKLDEAVKLLQTLEKFVKDRLKKGILTIYQGKLYGNTTFTINQE